MSACVVPLASAACGLAQLEGRRSRACRCSRGRRPSGSDSEGRDRLGVPPQRHPSGVGDPLTRTPLRRACRPQRPSSPLIAHADWGDQPSRTQGTTARRDRAGGTAGGTSHGSVGLGVVFTTRQRIGNRRATCAREQLATLRFVATLPPLYAHRLGREPGPDSSRAALQATLAGPVDGLETDACLTADGRLVLLHEPWLSGPTTLRGWAHQTLWSDLRRAPPARPPRRPDERDADAPRRAAGRRAP